MVAFLLLAVLPLAGIVFFSYWTSQRAFRQAVAAESTVLAEEMGDREPSLVEHGTFLRLFFRSHNRGNPTMWGCTGFSTANRV